MAFYDKSTMMFDAGMTVIKSEKGFGEILGQVRAQLSPFGKVLKISESGGKFLDAASSDEIPSGASECDIFVDSSSLFRRRYFAVQVQTASEGEYAILLKEGNRNAPARDFVTLFISAIGLIRLIMVPGVISKVTALVLVVVGLGLNALPSYRNIAKAKDILKQMENLSEKPVIEKN